MKIFICCIFFTHSIFSGNKLLTTAAEIPEFYFSGIPWLNNISKVISQVLNAFVPGIPGHADPWVQRAILPWPPPHRSVVAGRKAVGLAAGPCA